ncbi:MAG: oligoribonuclease [Pseudomonadota bacterium]
MAYDAHDNTPLIWIDLEMTGLNFQEDRIIEIATVITDSMLRVIARGPQLVIHQPDSLLDTMDEWNQSTHGRSGLIDEVRASDLTEDDAENETLDFLSHYVSAQQSPMCGNSICTDRRFLHRYMPRLEAYFHYRHLDVSTIKELARRWYPNMAQGYSKKSGEHRALSDVLLSIEELRYYRDQWLGPDAVLKERS